MWNKRALVVATLVGVLGCDDGDDVDVIEDAGRGMDAGPVADGAVEDAGVRTDAGRDGAPGPRDAALADGQVGAEVALAFCCSENTRSVGGTEGVEFNDHCDINEVLTGFNVFGNTMVEGLRPRCAELTVLESPGGARQVALDSGSSGSLHGQATSEPVRTACPPDEVVVGTFGQASEMAIAPLGFMCARPEMVSGGQEMALTLTGLTPSFSGSATGESFMIQCPAGKIATGVAGLEGSRIVRVGLVCARANLLE